MPTLKLSLVLSVSVFADPADHADRKEDGAISPQSTCVKKKKKPKTQGECGLITLMSLSSQELPLSGIVLSTGDPSSPQRHLQLAA